VASDRKSKKIMAAYNKIFMVAFNLKIHVLRVVMPSC